MYFQLRMKSIFLQLAILTMVFGCSLFEKEDPELSEILQCQVQKPLADLQWLEEIVSKEESYDKRSPMRIWVGDYEGTGVIIYENLVLSCYLCYVYDCEGNLAFETSLKGVNAVDFGSKVKKVKVLYSYKWIE